MRRSLRKSDQPEVDALGRWFAVRVFLFAALAAPLLLRFCRPQLHSYLEPEPRRRFRAEDLPPAAVEAIVRRIDGLLAAGKPFVRPGELTRGITLYYFLRRCGAPVSLRFDTGPCWLDLSNALQG